KAVRIDWQSSCPAMARAMRIKVVRTEILPPGRSLRIASITASCPMSSRWQVGTVAAHVFELAQLHRVAFGIVDDCDPHVILPLDEVGISAKATARPFQLPGDGLYIAHEHAEESPARSRQQVMVGTVARMVEAEALKKLEAFAKWALQLNDPISVAAVSD